MRSSAPPQLHLLLCRPPAWGKSQQHAAALTGSGQRGRLREIAESREKASRDAASHVRVVGHSPSRPFSVPRFGVRERWMVTAGEQKPSKAERRKGVGERGSSEEGPIPASAAEPAVETYPRAIPSRLGLLPSVPRVYPQLLESPISPLEEGPLGLGEQASTTGMMHFSYTLSLPLSVGPSFWPPSPSPGLTARWDFQHGTGWTTVSREQQRLSLNPPPPALHLVSQSLPSPPGTKKSECLSSSPEMCPLLPSPTDISPPFSLPGHPPAISCHLMLHVGPGRALAHLLPLVRLNPRPRGCSQPWVLPPTSKLPVWLSLA